MLLAVTLGYATGYMVTIEVQGVESYQGCGHILLLYGFNTNKCCA